MESSEQRDERSTPQSKKRSWPVLTPTQLTIVFLSSSGVALVLSGWALYLTKSTHESNIRHGIESLLFGFWVIFAVTWTGVGRILHQGAQQTQKFRDTILSDQVSNEQLIREFGALISLPATSLQAKIQLVFERGLHRLDLQEAVLFRVKGEWCEVIDVHSLREPSVRQGELIPLAGTYAEAVNRAKQKASADESLISDVQRIEGPNPALALQILAPVVVLGDVFGLLELEGVTQEAAPLPTHLQSVFTLLTANWLGWEYERSSLQSQLEHVSSLTNDILATLDFNGNIVDVNGSWLRILSFSKKDALNKIFLEFVHNDDVNAMRNLMAQLLAGRRVEGVQTRFVTKDGAYRWISWNAVPYLNEQRIFFSGQDITERKQSDNALRLARSSVDQIAKSRADFLTTMSHEIKTPLNAIVGMSDLLMETRVSPEQQNYLGILKQTALNLNDLINDIIDLSKLESENLQLETARFDLEEIVRRVKDLESTHAQKKNLAFLAMINPDVPRKLVGDSKRVMQILVNLVNNAVEYTSEGGVTIRVSHDPTTPAKGTVLFSIADTGIGIPQDQVKVIFERFGPQPSGFPGMGNVGSSGLSLTLCKRLVDVMGGRIWVESQLGKGSTFYFTIPFQVAEEQTESRQAAPTTAQEFGRRILLAEDSEDNQILVQTFLHAPSYHLEIAENGRIAVQKYMERKYDLVLMDLQMPVMDGLSATRAIRTLERDKGLAPTPIIALSATAHKDMVETSRSVGCSGLIAKPIDFEKLKETMAKYFPELEPQIPKKETGTAQPQPAGAGANATVISLNAAIKRMVPVFLANRAKDLSKIKHALSNRDFDSIRLIGHSMKGSGKSYGFAAISDLGARLEDAARKQDLEGTLREISSLEEWLENMRPEGGSSTG